MHNMIIHTRSAQLYLLDTLGIYIIILCQTRMEFKAPHSRSSKVICQCQGVSCWKSPGKIKALVGSYSATQISTVPPSDAS